MPRSFTFATITEYRAAKGNNGAIYAELVSSGIKSGSCVSKITATGDVFIDSINPFVTPELGQEGDTLYYSSTGGYRFLRAGNTTWDDQSYGQVYIDLAKIPSGFSVVAPFTDVFTFKKTTEDIGSGKASMTKILGNTVAWNQLLIIPNSSASKTESGVTIVDNRDGSYTVSTVAQGASANVYVNLQANYITGHKYLLKGCPHGGSGNSYVLYINSTSASNGYDFGDGTIATAKLSNLLVFPRIYIYSGVIITTPIVFRPILIDLTLMFGEGKEPATVEEFEALYPNPYYAYNAGTLISNKAKAIEFVGFNKWDEEWRNGYFSIYTGAFVANKDYVATKNPVPVLPNTEYYIYCGGISKGYIDEMCCYDASMNFLGMSTRNPSTHGNVTLAGTRFVHFRTSSSYHTGESPKVYNHDICINLSGKRNGQYEPYKKVVLPLPNLDQIKVYSHNLWDEEWEVGNISNSDGSEATDGNNIRSMFERAIPGASYYINTPKSLRFWWYDANKNAISGGVVTNSSTQTAPANAAFFRFGTTNAYGTTYNHDICINLSSSFNGQYEPHGILTMEGGLKSAGSVRDEIVGNKFVKKVGRVDLGNLVWSVVQGSSVFLSRDVVNATAFICSKYLFVDYTSVTSNNSAVDRMENGTLTYRHGSVNDRFYINDSAYTDAQTFKAAMQNEHVQLDYELATTIEYEIYSPTKMPFNWKYRVSEYHTKKMLPENGENPTSAPFACEIKQI